MRTGRDYLLFLLLPVLVVAGVAMLANMAALYNLKTHYEGDLARQRGDLGLLMEASRISEGMAATQQRVADTLDKARSGQLDERTLYRLHAREVDGLAQLTRQVEALGATLDKLGDAADARSLETHFASYRNYVMMATDIAAIEPGQAIHYVSQARDRYIAFARQAQHVGVHLGERVESTGLEAAQAFAAAYQQNVIVVGVGLLAMLALIVLAMRAIAAKVGTVAEALRLLAGSHDDPPPLPAIENIHATQSGALQMLAASVLSFRQTIIARRQAEDRLRLAASVFTHAQEGIMITAPDGTILDVNDAFCRIAGYPRTEVLERNPRILGSGRHSVDYFAAMWHALHEKGHWYGEIWNKRKQGELYAAALTISSVSDQGGQTQHYVALFSDITQSKEYERRLERMAHYDALTGLPNRVLLADRLQQAMRGVVRRGMRLAVVYLDLDGFKEVNDRHGHETGDQVLASVGLRLKESLREIDTISRVGGDEFIAVIVDQATDEACLPMLARLLEAVAQPIEIDGVVLGVSASLGVSFYPQAEAKEPDQLLRQADQAMYQGRFQIPSATPRSQ